MVLRLWRLCGSWWLGREGWKPKVAGGCVMIYFDRHYASLRIANGTGDPVVFQITVGDVREDVPSDAGTVVIESGGGWMYVPDRPFLG